MEPNRQHAMIWTNDNLLYWHIYASLSLNDLTRPWLNEYEGTGEFPAQMASNAENVSISWRHHVKENLYHDNKAVPLIRPYFPIINQNTCGQELNFHLGFPDHEQQF